MGRRRDGRVATETPLSFFGLEQTSQGSFQLRGWQMRVSGREVEIPKFGVVADTTFEPIPGHFVDVGVTDDSFSESEKERPRDRGTLVTDGTKNLVSAAENLIAVGQLLKGEPLVSVQSFRVHGTSGGSGHFRQALRSGRREMAFCTFCRSCIFVA